MDPEHAQYRLTAKECHLKAQHLKKICNTRNASRVLPIFTLCILKFMRSFEKTFTPQCYLLKVNLGYVVE